MRPGSEFTVGEVEADVVQVRVAPAIGHDVVPRLGRNGSQFGVRAQCPIWFADQQLVAGNDQQPTVWQPIEAERNRIDAADHLVPAVEVYSDHLTSTPVGENEPMSCQRGDSTRTRSLSKVWNSDMVIPTLAELELIGLGANITKWLRDCRVYLRRSSAPSGVGQSRAVSPGRSSIRCSATLAWCSVSGSTLIWLTTWPWARFSNAQTRCGRSIRFIVAQ